VKYTYRDTIGRRETDILSHCRQVGFPDEDVDVQNEREYILDTSLDVLFDTNAIVVYGMTKSFSGFRAVDNLTFRVPQVRYSSRCTSLRSSSCKHIAKSENRRKLTSEIKLISARNFDKSVSRHYLRLLLTVETARIFPVLAT